MVGSELVRCPKCQSVGQSVSSVTVRHMVLEGLRVVSDEEYSLCLNEGCDVVYYSGLDTLYRKDQVRVPVWFKNDASPRYICYCNKVTVEQLEDAVRNKGARTLRDLVKVTAVMKNGDCERQNPTGKCCSTAIMKIVHDILQSG
ncbi:MAG: hypothetical protein FD169_1829 [Bacillota bacterium]|nr:MAG: hypothetical protein FD169_1829 [Bacillota bacterium]